MFQSRVVRALGALALVVFPAFASAQDAVPLGDGRTITPGEFLVESAPGQPATLIFLMTPNFDPEPYGPISSDDFGRDFQQFCQNIVANSWDALQAQGIGRVVTRWDFTPTLSPATQNGITVTRFHEGLFELLPDRTCRPVPVGVGTDYVTPALPSGLPVRLEHLETGPTPRTLSLAYRLDQDPGLLPDDQVRNAAIELCLLHGDKALAQRAQYFGVRDYASLTVTFFHDSPGAGGRPERRARSFDFDVVDAACVSGLSPVLAEAIKADAP
jgi:hypothetical protein